MIKTKEDVISILDKYYYLCDTGLNCSTRWKRTKEDRLGGRNHSCREHLYSDTSIERILSAYDYIMDNLQFRKTKYDGFNSYYLKHIIESGQDRYISNGEFITAMLMTDCPYSLGKQIGNPNLYFAIKKKSLDNLFKYFKDNNIKYHVI